MTSSIQRRFGALLLAACYCATGSAEPTLPQVVAGQATFNQQGNVFSITNTPGAIINWQSFDIKAGEVTRFIQQNADSAVLNRVLGQDPTKILGALQSNGKVFLINPNGILFGQGARVDVNGLVASTLNISDADFKAGRKRFQAGPGEQTAGAVRNEGTIATPAGGQVFLIAPDVHNAGIIKSPGGDVILAAGHSVQLVDAGDPDLRVELSAPAGQAVNLGQVIAQGGRIGIYGALVNQRGVDNADSAALGANGRVVLKASRAVALDAASVTRARGSAGVDGGTVQVLGEQVDVAAGASVDAGGRNGGTVLVGGDWQGGGGAPRAQRTSVAAGAVIRADGSDGNGGKVVLWSDGATSVHGTVSARGSVAGGAVETSGHALDVDGIAVDAAGGKGGNGTWLLDPYDIEVVAGGTAGVGDVIAAAGDTAAGVTRVAPATLTAAGPDVVLQAQHDRTRTDAVDAAGSVRAQAGNDIRIDAQMSAGGDLHFAAGNAFTLGANGTLKTGNHIDVSANQVTLAGNIAGTGRLPTLALVAAEPGRPISIGAATAGTKAPAPDPVAQTRTGTATAGTDTLALDTAAPKGTGTATTGTDALVLDAAALKRLSTNLSEIKVGSGGHTAPVTVDGVLNLASSLVLENAGDIRVRAPVDLSANPGSRFVASQYAVGGLVDIAAPLTASASLLLQGDRLALGATASATSISLMPNSPATHLTVGGDGGTDGFVLTQASLNNVKSNDVTIGGLARGYGGIDVVGAVALTGSGASVKLTLDAGSGELALKAPLKAGTVALASTTGIYETGNGTIDAGAVALRGGQVVLTGANAIGTLAGNVDGSLFQVTTRDSLSIGTVDGLKGVMAPNASLQFISGGALALDAGVSAGASATVEAAGIAGTGLLQAGTLSLTSSAGIGTMTNPLQTRTGVLLAYNQGTGDRPISIANNGPLVLARAVQDGDGNAGAIAIDSVGGMTVPVYQGGDGSASGEVRTSSGDIDLMTHSPLTIKGRVTTASGNVRLLADNGGALTVEAGARVASGSGNVVITAGTTQIAADTVGVASPDRLQVNNGKGGMPDSTSPPTLDACLADHAAPGCAQVLGAAFGACMIDPSGSRCGDVLPTLTQCQGNSALAGCEVVLPTLAQCIGSPSLQGCDVRLPSLATCAAAPATAGGEAVLPTASFCSTHPGDANCVTFSGSGGTGQGAQGTPVAQAVQTTVQLINTAVPAAAALVAGGDDAPNGDAAAVKPGERQADQAQAEHTGVKNEKPATKLYCN
jgi:filamentous hemagglutinin family protein